MDGKEAARAHTLATSIFRHLASLQNEIPPLRAPQQSARWEYELIRYRLVRGGRPAASYYKVIGRSRAAPYYK